MPDFDAVFLQAIDIFWIPFLICLSGRGAKPECDSSETRLAVLQAVSDDHNNALAKYAAKNPNMAKSSDASSAVIPSRLKNSHDVNE